MPGIEITGVWIDEAATFTLPNDHIVVSNGECQIIGKAWPCFPAQTDWTEWHRQRLVAQETPHAFACTDCTPEYRDRMQAEGKCLYGQHVRFETDSDGVVVGLFPNEELVIGAHKDGRTGVLVRAIVKEPNAGNS